MGSSLDILGEWTVDPRASYEAPEIWSRAKAALARLKSDSPVELTQLVFDRFLDEDPKSLYRSVEKIDASVWPVLLDALERCKDLEARLLIAAHRKSEATRRKMAALVALAGATSNCPALAQKILASEAAKDPAVIELCLQAVVDGYPPFSVALAGAVACVAAFGGPAQVKTLWSVRPPDGAIRWLQAVAKKLPKDRAGPLREAIAGREPSDRLDREEGARFERRHRPGKTLAQQARPAPTLKRSSSKEELLAMVYQAPEQDEPRAVLADALMEQGDPLGELIQMQLARAGGRRGTLSKERLLFERHKATLWADHPCTLGGCFLTFEDIDRGFPARFKQPVPVSVGYPDLPGRTTLERLTRHAGWATVRRIRDGWGKRVPLASLLPEKMPLLDELQGIDLETLDEIGSLEWPVRRLELQGKRRPKPATGLPKVAEVEFETRMGWSETIELLEPSGLLERIRRLELFPQPGVGVTQALEAFDRLPASLRELRLTGETYTCSTLVREQGAPAITIEVDSFGLERVLAELAGFPRDRFSSLELVLSASGFFTKQSRPRAEAAARQVLERFANAKLTSERR